MGAAAPIIPLTAAGSRKIPPPTVVLKIAAERPSTPMARTRARSDSVRRMSRDERLEHGGDELMDRRFDPRFSSHPCDRPAQPRKLQSTAALQILEHRRLRVVGEALHELRGVLRQRAREGDAPTAADGDRFV